MVASGMARGNLRGGRAILAIHHSVLATQAEQGGSQLWKNASRPLHVLSIGIPKLIHHHSQANWLPAWL
ncbi:hypothetical protein KSC_023070 [Ktedonobacter sp. SOSP1-52]|uniref:hypothetical protein n=1 Tax=Ktedonobacter sp. SOSP1-52 TaxID=2778366 RepID=UPI00191587EC|nr:hypothetical protein [Ktedonobacter sp. SOSP1-52]GHO63415.1 hypothetical protein KSC_023070 [Ktedonobacter sp. SOSP1-52]